MEKTARVLITTECNLECSYCCNKIPEVQQSFNITTFDEFIEKDYEDVNISGGEPMLSPNKLEKLINKLIQKKNKPNLFLYTNGFRATDGAARFGDKIDGVNIGCHDNMDFAIKAAMIWVQKNPNVRFYIEEGRLTVTVKTILENNGIRIKEWKMNDCDNTPEDRWII